MEKLLKDLYYSRTSPDRGEMKEFIKSWLGDNGMGHSEDSHGNVWVRKGAIGDETVFSSNMDSYLGSDENIVETFDGRYGRILKGNLNGVIGCYLNMVSAEKAGPGKRKSFVFTVSGLEDSEKPEVWGKSADAIVQDYKVSGSVPSLFVSVDMSYPMNLKPDSIIYNMEDEKWDGTPYGKMFDENDRTPCYIEGFSYRKGKSHVDGFRYENHEPAVKKIFEGYHGSGVKMKRFQGFDEASKYGKMCTAFSTGAVSYGKPDVSGQIVPTENIKVAEKFLEYLVNRN